MTILESGDKEHRRTMASHFDPQVHQVFLAHHQVFAEMYESLSDGPEPSRSESEDSARGGAQRSSE